MENTFNNQVMDKIMKDYLRWRFCSRVPSRYIKYFDEWITGVTNEQMAYFEKERERLINQGVYNVY